MSELKHYQIKKVQIDQAATNIRRAIKPMPCGFFACAMMMWRFLVGAFVDVGFDIGFFLLKKFQINFSKADKFAWLSFD